MYNFSEFNDPHDALLDVAQKYQKRPPGALHNNPSYKHERIGTKSRKH